MSDNNKIKKILYKTNLKLETALHIGCAQKSPVGSFDMMQNGAGEYLIPGTSIAGVFIDTLRDLIDLGDQNNKTLYYKISDTEEINGEKKNRGSALVFRSVNLGESPPKQIRNRTKIDRETKTADEGALFSYWEIEPENVSFEVKIEIDNLSVKNKDEDIKTLQNWVKLIFASWRKEGVFFGGHNSSGNGFCTLEKAEEWVIDSEAKFKNYLDNETKYSNISEYPKEIMQRFKTWTITVDMNDEEDSYGTNALLIKGGVSHTSLAGNPSDGVFINTGKRLFIPGSSLKGTFSMFLEKYEKKDWLKDFFGQEGSDKQGYIYFPDLIFPDKMNDGKKHLINIERHAEDEFTRAVYGSSKFNEERLFYAKGEGKIRVPLEEAEAVKDLFEFMQQGCKHRLISLGANGCYPKITIVED